MNDAHLKYCASDEWAEAVNRWIIPGALAGVTLGTAVLEIGPGPGRTTERLRELTSSLTAVELDTKLARQLAARLGAAGVRVIQGDATTLPFPAASFSAVVSLTMLHHVPSVADQDRLFAEVARILRPGATFVGVDSRDGEDFRALHVDDICVPLDPGTLDRRLHEAGFASVNVDPNPYVIQFHATV